MIKINYKFHDHKKERKEKKSMGIIFLNQNNVPSVYIIPNHIIPKQAILYQILLINALMHSKNIVSGAKIINQLI